VAKAVTEYIEKVSKYKAVKKVISVSILYFDLGQGQDYIYQGRTNFIGMHKKDELLLSEKQKKEFRKDKIHEIFPEYYLIKVNQFDDLAKNTLDEWIYFLKNEQIKKKFTAKGLQEANEKLQVLKLPAEKRQEYQTHLEALHDKASFYLSTFVQGKREGISEGIQRGKQEGRTEIIINMHQNGLDLAAIAKLTGLTIQEIHFIIDQ